MTIVTNDERLAMNDRPLLDRLNEIWTNHRERFAVNHSVRELIVNFGGDNNQASNFEKMVPAFAFKGRFADTVTFDLEALEKIYGRQLFSRRRGWFTRLFDARWQMKRPDYASVSVLPRDPADMF